MKAFFFLNMVMCTFVVCGMEDRRNSSPAKNNSKIMITNSTETLLGASKGARPRSSEVTSSIRRTNSVSGGSSPKRTHASVLIERISAENLQLITEEAIFKNVQGKLIKIVNK